MPRPERVLDLGSGALAEFAAELRKLRERAGNPGYRQLAGRAHYSATTLSDAAGGRKLPSLAVTLAYVRACGGDTAAWEARWRRTWAELTASRQTTAGSTQRASLVPYLGLAAFQPEDAGRFFGRERLVEDLLARLGERRCLMVFGISGVGKSSVLRAGLIARIRVDRPHWVTVLFTPGPRPLRECAVALAGVLDTPAVTLSSGPGPDPDNLRLVIRRTLARLPANSELVIVVDQFEEVFTLCQDADERRGFVATLLAAAQTPDSRIRLVLGVRADFYAACTQYPQLAAMLRDGQVPVCPMGVEELRRAVIQPAAAAGYTVDSALLARVIADAGGQPGVLPLVSHALLETWHRRRGNALTLAGYEAAGGVADALAQTAESCYATLSADQQRRTRLIFLRLIAPGVGCEDTTQHTTRVDLDLDPDTIAALDTLAKARLLTLDDEGVQMTHEALIRAWPRLRGWLDEDRAGLRVHRQLAAAAHAWEGVGRDPDSVYRGALLASARSWADRTPDAPNRVERDFLAASVAAELREHRAIQRRGRQLRWLAAALAILLATSIGFLVVALGQRHQAQSQRQVARSRQLATLAALAAGTDIERAMRWSLDGWAAAATPEARSALLSLASRPTYHGRFHLAAGEYVPAALSADGRRMAVFARGEIEVWDLVARSRVAAIIAQLQNQNVADQTTRQFLTRLSRGVNFAGVALDAGGQQLAVVTDAGEILRWDGRHGASAVTVLTHGGPTSAVALSPDGQLLASTGVDGVIKIWDTRTSQQVQTLAEPGAIDLAYAVAISPDKRTLTTVGHGNTVTLWDLPTRRRTTLISGRGVATAAAFSPDGRNLATAGTDGVITVWEPATGARIAELDADTRPVTAIAFDHTGATLVSIMDNRVLWWDLGRRERLYEVSTSEPDGLRQLSVNPAGEVVVASGDAAVLSWYPAQLPLSNGKAFEGVAFSSDAHRLSALDSSGTLRSWDESRHSTDTVAVGPLSVPTFAFSLDGRLLAIATTPPAGTTVWDVGRHQRLDVLRDPLAAPTEQITHVALSADGAHLAAVAVGSDVKTQIWDVTTRTLTGKLESSINPRCLTFHPNGQWLALAADNGRIEIWDTQRNKLLKTLREGVAPSAIAFDPPGRRLAVADQNGAVDLWDLAGSHRTASLSGHAGPINAIAFSPNGRLLASAGADKSIVIWDTSTATRWATLTGHTRPVNSLAWHPDGNTLATASDDQTVTLWTTDTDRAVHQLCTALADNFPTGQPPPAACQHRRRRLVRRRVRFPR